MWLHLTAVLVQVQQGNLPQLAPSRGTCVHLQPCWQGHCVWSGLLPAPLPCSNGHICIRLVAASLLLGLRWHLILCP